jgi:plastocyanin
MNTAPQTKIALRAAGAGLMALVLAACAGGSSVAWTYAPLGPTADPNASPTADPNATPAPTAAATVEVATPQSNALAFEPNTLEFPAASVVQVTYLNDSNLPHNINFFAGPDNSAPSLGATPVVTGPGAPETVTFTTPEEPGDYYFWCDVHLQAMSGTYTVQ